MRRLLPLFAALLGLLLLLSACQNNTNPPTADTTAAPVVTEAPPSDIELVRNGVANYTIIRPETADQDVIEAASRLRKMIGLYTGVTPVIATDWIKPGEEYNADTTEILIGMTAYPESAQVMDGITYGDFVIKHIGNKLVINAWSSKGLDRAVTELAKRMMEEATDGNFSLPGDYSAAGTAVEEINGVPLYPDGEFGSICVAGKDNYLLIFEETDADAYRAYLRTLANSGYTETAVNAIAENEFAVYQNDSRMLHIGYYAYCNQVRMNVTSPADLPIVAEENKYETLVQPRFAMIGLESQSDLQNGQSFIWQLADGSFIIVDGGFDNSHDSRALYAYMQKHAPDPNNITIAAWFITHLHGDHHGAFLNFCSAYSGSVKLERLIGNFVTKDFSTASDLSSASHSSFALSADKHFGAQFIAPHAGQKFYLRDAEIEILYTQENILPKTMSDLNTASLVFAVNIGGQRFLVLADATESACSILFKMYGDTLKSDYIQAAHHGYSNGGSSSQGISSVYTAAAAPVVLWPVGDYNYRNVVGGYSYSAQLQRQESTKEIVVAGSRVFDIALPYTVGTSSQDTILK